MAEEFDNGVAAVCADLTAIIRESMDKETILRAQTWLEANRDADQWVEDDLDLARSVIAFLQAIPGRERTPEIRAIGNRLSNPALVLLWKRLVELPPVVRALEPLVPALTLRVVLDKALLEPWVNGLRLRTDVRPQRPETN